MTYNTFAFLLLGFLLVAAAVARPTGRSWYPYSFLVAAVVLRIVGSLARYEVLFRFYHGAGDAVRYYSEGLEHAERLLNLQQTVFSPAYWALENARWGTAFVIQLSGIVLSVIGESLRAEFLVFSCFAFLGLYLIAKAFARVRPKKFTYAFAAWIWFWPSLWFWPSSVGKEALIVLAFGITAYGFVGTGRRTQWLFVAMGIGLAFMLRPHVAAVLAFAVAIGVVLAPARGGITPRRLVEIGITILIGVLALRGVQQQFGLADVDVETVREFIEWNAGQTLQGGSQIGAVPSGWLAAPTAFVNVWARPFPWEAHNKTSAFSAAEVVLLWLLLLRRRRYLGPTLRNWRKDPLLRFGLPLLVAYTLMIGLTFANLGIIARQRAPMFPFLFVLFAAAPIPAAKRLRVRLVGGRRRRRAVGVS